MEIRKLINVSPFIGYPNDNKTGNVDYSRFITMGGVKDIISETVTGSVNTHKFTRGTGNNVLSIYFLNPGVLNDVPAINALNTALTACGIGTADDFTFEVHYDNNALVIDNEVTNNAQVDALLDAAKNDIEDVDKEINKFALFARNATTDSHIEDLTSVKYKLTETGNYSTFSDGVAVDNNTIVYIEIIDNTTVNKAKVKFVNEKAQIKYNGKLVSNVTSATGTHTFTIKTPKNATTRENIIEIETEVVSQ